ncbi:cell division protein ZipA [Pseudomonadota bacterium]
MDSLLVILAVIGVVMILAGVARMRSKKKHSWDDIDHSVLFTKKDEPQKAVATGGDVSIASHDSKLSAKVDDELGAEEEFEFLDNLLKDKEGDGVASGVSVKIDEDDRRDEHDSGETKPTAPKARSLFDKLRSAATDTSKDEVDEDDEDILDPCYRDGAPEKIIVLNVMAPKGKHFTGVAVVDVARNNGLIFGDMNILHLQRGKEHVFSVVNMVKPGVFDADTIETLTTPGVSLFVQLPNNLGNCVSAFDTMLETGQSFAAELGGELRDESRCVLTHSAIDHIREQMIEYDCKWLNH